ncbi:MAG: alpha/beta hydrolase [Methanothrix sp.]|nr:alpha/beta hydrolase [Methanothrix sp.]
MTILCQGHSHLGTQSFGPNPRRYGQPPFNLAVVHGGPGAAGEMAPVARELSMIRGALEPMQTAGTLNGQVEELKVLLEENANPPMTLIGFSWGAWLSFILAARYPDLVKELVLVSSGPFLERYACQILPTRLSRLDKTERLEVEGILGALEGPAGSCGDRGISRLGEILSSCDSFDPIAGLNSEILADVQCQAQIYQSVWKEAELLRRTGELLEMGRRISCSVVAIHGDWDPHPAEGVAEPLSSVLKSFEFILLANCGHKPWIERLAKDKFYSVLKTLIA